jgi:hypothetical protein
MNKIMFEIQHKKKLYLQMLFPVKASFILPAHICVYRIGPAFGLRKELENVTSRNGKDKKRNFRCSCVATRAAAKK